MRLLVTRPQPDAERTATALRARGHATIVAPLLGIEPVDGVELGGGPWAAILVTSANAAAAIARHSRFAELKGLSVLAVGERSAQAMRDVGFADVISAGGGAGDLTRLAAERLKPTAPLLRIEPVDNAELGSGPWAAILITSANAAAAIARHHRFTELKGLPVLAVGERSARAMRDVGFADVISAGGGANDLTRLAAERLKQGVSLLYLAGAERSGDIAGDLAAQNFIVRTAVVYRALAAAALPHAAAEVLAGRIDGVLHFSKRSAEAYIKAVQAAGLTDSGIKKPVHFCLSAEVAEPLAHAGAANIRTASRRDEASLLALIPAA